MRELCAFRRSRPLIPTDRDQLFRLIATSAARVQRQVAGLFVAEERGRHELKGVPEPVILFRLVRASGGGRRAGQRRLTPLVGRDEEIAMLMRRWERAAGRRETGIDRWRAGSRQVAADRVAGGTASPTTGSFGPLNRRAGSIGAY
jgi:hypothetical protein